ncbi:MAG: sulfite exporter TauE/SafE family protein, partial [Pedobacter sp.]
MIQEIILLCAVSFFAGFIDAIVGGGGLLQTPAMLIILPQFPVATLFGTTKIPSVTGTAFAAYKYSRNVMINWELLCPIIATARHPLSSSRSHQQPSLSPKLAGYSSRDSLRGLG